jgi:hypothetical protein
MKIFVFIILTAISFQSEAQKLKTNVPKSFAQLMKVAIDYKDAPATCWYLGRAQGYLDALKDSGNEKAAKLSKELQGNEGKCGGKNGLDLKTTFTADEWQRLEVLRAKIETAEF